MGPLLLMKSITILIAHVSVLLAISFISLSECDENTITNNTNTTTSLSHSQRVDDAVNKSSFNRRVAANQQSQAATANVTKHDDGFYYLQIYIGNPRIPISGVMDTANDLIWTSSCNYKPFMCGTNQCNLYPERTCSGKNTKCIYSTHFASGSTIKGTLSTGTIAFTPAGGSQIENAILGCGTDSDGTVGGVGLGGGNISLVHQLGITKFGFCLAPYGDTSKLHLGDNAVAAGGVVVPLAPIPNKPTFYRVSVGSIIVGNSNKPLKLGGHMLIATGATNTTFPGFFYDPFLGELKAELKASIGRKNIIRAPSGLKSDLCIAKQPSNFNATVVFGNNKSLTWKLENLFLQFDENLWCLAAGISTVEDGISTVEDSIYGSTALTNFAVGLDLKANTVTFLPTACAGK